MDEAHHGFGKDTLAAKFFRDVLKPEYTVLITATPDDADVKEFEKAMGILELQRISVSRADAVDVGLIKKGVKCAAYFVDPDKKSLVDLQGTALRDGVAIHRKLKQALADLKVPLVPLLLVQADSAEKSVEKLKERLLRLGFTEEQIAVHTADKPDGGLLALANDERREVLVFKMAVAQGFDAPRAFCLVSMRASRDPDFGVQLVGRILRVHRRLQSRAQAKTLPETLSYGYVFLADAETQAGLDIAGQRINQIQTLYAKASTATVAMRFGDDLPGVGIVGPGGQLPLFRPADDDDEPEPAGIDRSGAESPGLFTQHDIDFGTFFGGGADPVDGKPAPGRPVKVAGPVGPHRYPLRPGVPRRFKTQEVSTNVEVTEEDCANRFLVSTRELFAVMKGKIPVQRRTLDVFRHEIQLELNFAADLSPDQAATLAQRALLLNKTFDPRELRRALLRKMEAVMREETMSEAEDPEQVAHFLNVILAAEPHLLHDAQKAANNQHAEVLDAEPLPAEIESAEPLASSPRNVYGVVPPGLNSWEALFAGKLDGAAADTVLWWHRNVPHKPWSVNVLMPDGRGFYPDFVIGIKGRKKEDQALLADPKYNFQSDDQAAKVLAQHRAYGRVMILYLHGGTRWMTVDFDHKANKAVIGREFRVSDAAGF